MIYKNKCHTDPRVEITGGPWKGSWLVTKSVVAETLLVARIVHGSGGR
jgi:hypothetical protein